MESTHFNLLLLILSLLSAVCYGKNQQQYILPDSYIDFKYLTTMFILMTVALVIVMGIIIFLNVLIEDLFPNWKVHFCGGGKDLGDDPFSAQGRRSTSGNVGGGGGSSAAAATPAAGKKKNDKKSARKATTSNVKESKPGKKAAGGQSKSKQGKDSKAKDSKAKGSKAKDSKVSSAAKGGSSAATRK